MKKYSLIVLLFAGIACALYAAWPRNLQQNVISGVSAYANSAYADVDMDTLDNYNANYGPDGYGQRLDVAAIKGFLANQILDFGQVTKAKQDMDPTHFRYLVGDRWEARQVGKNRYELIIPSNLPSLLDTYKMLFGQAYSPEYSYNINDLDKTLKQGEINNERLDRYRVEIIKALVGLKRHTVFDMLTMIAEGTWVEAVASAAGQLNPLVYGMKSLYDQLANMQSGEALQAEVDLYIVATVSYTHLTLPTILRV